MTEPLAIRNLTAHYGATQVLTDLSLTVGAGELVSLLGASGCGKTTTLRVVAGFLPPSAGTVTLGGRDLTRLPAHRRDIALVFQTYAQYRHLSVRDNVAFGLKQRGMGGAERQRKADAMLDRVGLSALADRLPGALSGGQRQRVALARALVIEPPLLMFDEPLSNLDAKLRVEMRVEIRQLQRANGTTSIYVTHDQEEAFSISDRVAIMNAGRIEQLDTPETLYRKPANAFVARFVGFENLIPLTLAARQGDARGGGRCRWAAPDAARRARPLPRPLHAGHPPRRADGHARPRGAGHPRPAGAAHLSGPGLSVSGADGGGAADRQRPADRAARSWHDRAPRPGPRTLLHPAADLTLRP